MYEDPLHDGLHSMTFARGTSAYWLDWPPTGIRGFSFFVFLLVQKFRRIMKEKQQKETKGGIYYGKGKNL